MPSEQSEMSEKPVKTPTKGVGGPTSRFAQACDRCRIKRIRCDGLVNQCSPCAAAALDCKTTAKLARRPVSGGYTRYLEETVRSLEGQVRSLNAIIEDKDRRISFFEACSPRPYHNGAPTTVPLQNTVMAPHLHDPQYIPRWESDLIESLPPIPAADGESPQSAPSSTENGSVVLEPRPLILQHDAPGISTDTFQWSALDGDVVYSELDTSPMPQLQKGSMYSTPPALETAPVWKIPPRFVFDQMVDIFFQDWAPMFPVLHHLTFYNLYESYFQNPTLIDDTMSIALLNLVFCIASLSSRFPYPRDTAYYETQWRLALDASMPCDSLTGVQCLILAQIYCIEKGDVSSQLRYMGIAVQASQKLGLHETQDKFEQGALTTETRKRVFWTLYTLDYFAAAQLGLPRIIKEEDIYCEYPTDFTDDSVIDKSLGPGPVISGNDTKLAAMLSVFPGSRILVQYLEATHVPTASGIEVAQCA